MVKRLRLQNFTNLDSAILPCPELDVDGIVRRILEPAQVGSDSDDDGPPTPEACNTDQARALTVLLSACSDGKTLTELQADLVACRRACVETCIHTLLQLLSFFFSQNSFFLSYSRLFGRIGGSHRVREIHASPRS